ncbi:hypothetical protein A0128_20310 [Leptospira tipperaryensis]|uniref:PD-(D/E)XK motif protein n=1 Tax=Leptospira tipperaryensis TaxID=2564040 RepID=A0A1D7V3F0_9LEPT|nr:PD-(D/E)XK motif protein [Leptospira tipperaryensis]AOP36364.1 hypothetical protein A0128_20310 [Leptospira tipperaryensis]
MNQLLKLFESINVENESECIFTKKLSQSSIYRVGKDKEGLPYFLISIDIKKSSRSLLPISLQNLSVVHDVYCKIFEKNEFEDYFTIIKCTSLDQLLHQYFFEIILSLLRVIKEQPSEEEINLFIRKIVDLFICIDEEPKKSVQGLWAELFLINESLDKRLLISSWHEIPSNIFDFQNSSTNLEVKSTLSNFRRHSFNYEQLKPDPFRQSFVISILMKENSRGTNIRELIEAIRKSLKGDSNSIIKVDQIIYSSVGKNWQHIDSFKFDIEFSKKSTKIYSIVDIPCIQHNIPNELSKIRFDCDLSNIKPISPSLKNKDELLKVISVL